MARDLAIDLGTANTLVYARGQGIILNEPTRTASSATTPPSEITATSLVPPPMSTIMLPSGSWIGSDAPMAAAMGCSIRYVWAAPARRAASSTARCSTCVMADGTQMSTRARCRREMPARWNSMRMRRCVISKSVIAPPRSGRTATM